MVSITLPDPNVTSGIVEVESTLKFKVVDPDPVLFEAVTVYTVVGEVTMGVPEMAQVVSLKLNKTGSVGEIVHDVITPVVDGIWVAAFPAVSTTELGEKDTVGLAIRTLRLDVAVSEPVLFVAVTL